MVQSPQGQPCILVLRSERVVSRSRCDLITSAEWHQDVLKAQVDAKKSRSTIETRLKAVAEAKQSREAKEGPRSVTSIAACQQEL